MKIAIFGNAMKDETLREVKHLLAFMQLRNVEVLLSQELRQELNMRHYDVYPREDEDLKSGQEPVDFALSVGGDGTFLTTAAAIGRSNVPILGINCGRLGFLAEVQTQDVDQIMDQLIRGDYTIEQRPLLTVTTSERDRITAPNALNEVAVMKQGLSSMISIETRLNGELLHTYEADGLIIATATGSTAYNLSVGGPLMMPQTKGILLSPIASHSLNVRPLVVPDDKVIDMVVRSRNGGYMVSVDGRSQIFTDNIRLHVEKANYTIKLVQTGEKDFIHSLKAKLNWGI
ncbi:MAG: NAD kinase [Paludibacteraceae bacterium]|nr:NAD kinase [Paludibacteraceae bacterium]